MPCRRKRLIHHGLVAQGYASRRICKILHLSHVHAKALEGLSDEALIERIRVLAFRHKRYGYRRIWVLLRRQDILIVTGVHFGWHEKVECLGLYHLPQGIAGIRSMPAMGELVRSLVA